MVTWWQKALRWLCCLVPLRGAPTVDDLLGPPHRYPTTEREARAAGSAHACMDCDRIDVKRTLYTDPPCAQNARCFDWGDKTP